MNRQEPLGMLGTDSWEEQAKYCSQYFANLWQHQADTRWLLGLFMAKQWLKFLTEPEPDVEELRLFLKVLEAEKQNHGSIWLDLFYRVRNWLDSIEVQQ